MASDLSTSSDEDDIQDNSFISDLGASLNLPSSSAPSKGKQHQRSLKVVSVFSRNESSFKALLDLVTVCKTIEAQLDQLSFQRLDFGELEALDQFYSSDVAIVDATLTKEQPTLFYHLGIRESFGMKDNIVMIHDEEDARTSSVQVCGFCWGGLKSNRIEEKGYKHDFIISIGPGDFLEAPLAMQDYYLAILYSWTSKKRPSLPKLTTFKYQPMNLSLKFPLDGRLTSE